MARSKIPEGITGGQLCEIYQKLDGIVKLFGQNSPALVILCLNDSDDATGKSAVHIAWAESKALAQARAKSGQVHPGFHRFGDRCASRLFQETLTQIAAGNPVVPRWSRQFRGDTLDGNKLSNNVVRRLYNLSYQINTGIVIDKMCVGTLGFALGKAPSAGKLTSLKNEITKWGGKGSALSELASYLKENLEITGLPVKT
jgi:hypothetical protein